jgi:hypothetical protein
MGERGKIYSERNMVEFYLTKPLLFIFVISKTTLLDADWLRRVHIISLCNKAQLMIFPKQTK